MGTSPTYTPIPCVQHERLEFAVLRRQELRLRLRHGVDATEELIVLPTDVVTRDGAEWLSFETGSGQTQVVRLDHILDFEYL